MNLIEVQSLFQHHGHTEHPLFRKFRIPGHLLHRHIAVHGHGGHGLGEYRRLEKIQLALHHLLYAEIGSGGGELKGQRRHLQLIKLNDLYVLVQIKLVQLAQKLGNAVAARHLHRLLQKPAFDFHIAHRQIAQRVGIAADQLRDGRYLRGGAHLPRHKGGDRRRKLLGIARLSRAVANAENGGGIVIGRLTQTGQIDVERGNQRVKILSQHLPVGGVEILADHKGFLHRIGGDIRQPIPGGNFRNGTAQRLKGSCSPLRHPLAVSVPAERSRRYAGYAAKLPGRAGQLFDVRIQFLAEFHKHYSVTVV